MAELGSLALTQPFHRGFEHHRVGFAEDGRDARGEGAALHGRQQLAGQSASSTLASPHQPVGTKLPISMLGIMRTLYKAVGWAILVECIAAFIAFAGFLVGGAAPFGNATFAGRVLLLLSAGLHNPSLLFFSYANGTYVWALAVQPVVWTFLFYCWLAAPDDNPWSLSRGRAAGFIATASVLTFSSWKLMRLELTEAELNLCIPLSLVTPLLSVLLGLRLSISHQLNRPRE